MATPAITPPAGGFQNGGWYGGQQYWNGQFGAPGVINNPNQQGAGQAVSQQVNQQTSVAAGKAPDANQNFINQQNANPAAQIPANATAGLPGSSAGASFGTPGAQNPAAPTFDLVAATNAAYNTPEITAANKAITDATTELTTRQQALADAQSGINDNPFYSEATRVGKSQQLTQQANNDMTVIQNKISEAQGQVASLKADAAIKVNAAQGQYNIEEQAYQTNLSNFNNLVAQGALDNASGTDIANLAVQTGIPTSMIQGIIDTSKKKDNPVSVVQATVGSDLQLIAVDSNGKVVNTTTIPGAGAQTKAAGKSDTNNLKPADYINYLTNDIKNKITLKSLIQKYQPYVSIDKIYQIYSNNSPWGAPKETLAQVKSGQYSD